MTVHFFATLRAIVGAKTMEFAVPAGTTVGALIEQIVTRFPPLRAELLDEEGQLHRYVHFLINGRDVRFLPQGMATPLTASEKIDIFPAVGGGA